MRCQSLIFSAPVIMSALVLKVVRGRVSLNPTASAINQTLDVWLHLIYNFCDEFLQNSGESSFAEGSYLHFHLYLNFIYFTFILFYRHAIVHSTQFYKNIMMGQNTVSSQHCS